MHVFLCLWNMVPTWTGKPGKMGEHFPNQKKNWKSLGNLPASKSENPANMVPYFKLKKNLKTYLKTMKNTGKMREICQSEEVGTIME